MNGMPEAGKESLLCHATANEPANPAFMQQGPFDVTTEQLGDALQI
jgi:hypothetical protein